MHRLIQTLADWYTQALQSWGAPAIGLMMVLESTIIPIPSELVIPPAAHWSNIGKIQVSITAIIIAGTLGSWVGASIKIGRAHV